MKRYQPFPPLDQLRIAAVEYLEYDAPWFYVELRIAHGRIIEHYIPIPPTLIVTNATTSCPRDILTATGTETELQARYPGVIFSFDRLYGVDEYLPLFLPVESGTMPPELDNKIFGRFKLNPFDYPRLDPTLPDPVYEEYYYTPRKKNA